MNIAQTDLKQNEYWTISDTMADNPDMGGMKGDYLELGQPYYVGAMYWGCEFPETENKIKGSNSFIRYYYGKSLKSDDKFEYNEGNENGKNDDVGRCRRSCPKQRLQRDTERFL